MLRRFLLLIFPIVFVGCASTSEQHVEKTPSVVPATETAHLFTGPRTPAAEEQMIEASSKNNTYRKDLFGEEPAPVAKETPVVAQEDTTLAEPKPEAVFEAPDELDVAALETEVVPEEPAPSFRVTASERASQILATAQITDPDLISSIQIQQQLVKRLTRFNVCLAETRIKNVLAEPIEIQTLVQFKNGEGETVSNTHWKYNVLLPGQEISVTDTTLSPDASRFILYIRRPHSLRINDTELSARLNVITALKNPTGIDNLL